MKYFCVGKYLLKLFILVSINSIIYTIIYNTALRVHVPSQISVYKLLKCYHCHLIFHCSLSLKHAHQCVNVFPMPPNRFTGVFVY